jgi:putative 4-mercaptohistidine N1-methyltranferase
MMKTASNPVDYESDRLLSEYLEFHYGPNYFAVANYAKAIANIALSACQHLSALTSALDLGCAVGRTAFELSKKFDCVYGVDFSTQFINAATKIQAQGSIKYSLITEGELREDREFTLASIAITPEQAKRVQFIQGDACYLHSYLTKLDLIIAANLIDRLYDPQIFLNSIHERLNPDGILVISSPYTWLEQHTEKSKWLGGFEIHGEKVTTLAGIGKILSPHL